MKRMLLIVAALGAAYLASFFDGDANHGKKGDPIESTKAAVESVLADKEGNEGRRFAITGYLNYSAQEAVYVNRPQTVYVSSEPGKLGNWIAMADMHWQEDGRNSVFVPQDGAGDESKTIFYDNDGKSLTMNDKVVVSFGVSDQSVDIVDIRIDRAQ